jgi:hypothetical protein
MRRIYRTLATRKKQQEDRQGFKGPPERQSQIFTLLFLDYSEACLTLSGPVKIVPLGNRLIRGA